MDITIKDVAKKAGVSIATVSRVINNRDRVKDSTRQKIKSVIEELNYKPNQTARTMVMGLSRSIGLIVPTLTNEYWAYLAEHIQEELLARNYTLILLIADTYSEQLVAFKNMKENKVAGIIYCGTIYKSIIEEYNLPSIVTLYDKIDKISSVSSDDINGSFNAVNYLFELGHKKIGFIGGKSVDNDRECGYKKSYKFNNTPIRDKYIYRIDYISNKTIEKATKSLLKEGVTAFFCAADEMAITNISILQNMGYKVPDDISVIGYDNIKHSRLIKPRLTTVNQPVKNIAKSLIENIMKTIEKDKTPQDKVLETNLIIRESAIKLTNK